VAATREQAEEALAHLPAPYGARALIEAGRIERWLGSLGAKAGEVAIETRLVLEKQVMRVPGHDGDALRAARHFACGDWSACVRACGWIRTKGQG